MVSFKTNNAKVAFGFTIVLIVIFFVFIYAYLKFIRSSKENDFILGLMMLSGMFILISTIVLSIKNNEYRKNKELSDSDTMDNALSGIPPTILICSLVIIGIGVLFNKPASVIITSNAPGSRNLPYVYRKEKYTDPTKYNGVNY